MEKVKKLTKEVMNEINRQIKIDRITKDVMSVLNDLVCNEEKWITIKPHGDVSEDYRRLKLEDGETPKQAIDRVYKKEDAKKNTENYTKKLGVKITNLKDFTPEIIQVINEAIETLPINDRPEYITSFKQAIKDGDFYNELTQRSKKSYGLSWNIHKLHKNNDNKYTETNTAVFFNSKYKKLEDIEKKKKEYNLNNFTGKPYYFNTNGKATFFHEMGHQFEQKHGIDEEFKKLADKWANSTDFGNIKKVEYGRIKENQGANYKEAFAEAWAGYYTNNNQLPDYIKKYFDKKQFHKQKTGLPEL